MSYDEFMDAVGTGSDVELPEYVELDNVDLPFKETDLPWEETSKPSTDIPAWAYEIPQDHSPVETSEEYVENGSSEPASDYPWDDTSSKPSTDILPWAYEIPQDNSPMDQNVDYPLDAGTTEHILPFNPASADVTEEMSAPEAAVVPPVSEVAETEEPVAVSPVTEEPVAVSPETSEKEAENPAIPSEDANPSEGKEEKVYLVTLLANGTSISEKVDAKTEEEALQIARAAHPELTDIDYKVAVDVNSPGGKKEKKYRVMLFPKDADHIIEEYEAKSDEEAIQMACTAHPEFTEFYYKTAHEIDQELPPPVMLEDDFAEVKEKNLSEEESSKLYILQHYGISPDMLNALASGDFSKTWEMIQKANAENEAVKAKLLAEAGNVRDDRIKIIKYLVDEATRKPEFSKQILLEHKSFKRCYETIKKHLMEEFEGHRDSVVQVDDDKVYRWAVDYYNLDDYAEIMEERRKAEEKRIEQEEKKRAEEAKRKKKAADAKSKTKTKTKPAAKAEKKAKTEAKAEPKAEPEYLKDSDCQVVAENGQLTFAF